VLKCDVVQRPTSAGCRAKLALAAIASPRISSIHYSRSVSSSSGAVAAATPTGSRHSTTASAVASTSIQFSRTAKPSPPKRRPNSRRWSGLHLGSLTAEEVSRAGEYAELSQTVWNRNLKIEIPAKLDDPLTPHSPPNLG